MLDKLKKWRYYRKAVTAGAAAGLVLLHAWWPDHKLDDTEIGDAIIAGLGALGVLVVRNKPKPPVNS
jgi:hypothetical protein